MPEIVLVLKDIQSELSLYISPYYVQIQGDRLDYNTPANRLQKRFRKRISTLFYILTRFDWGYLMTMLNIHTQHTVFLCLHHYIKCKCSGKRVHYMCPTIGFGYNDWTHIMNWETT